MKPLLKTLAAAALLAITGAHAAGTVGTSFPTGFPSIKDASLRRPVSGFGAACAVTRTPVIQQHRLPLRQGYAGGQQACALRSKALEVRKEHGPRGGTPLRWG